MPRLRLEWTEPDGHRSSFEDDGDRIRIGRSPSCELVLPHPFVSMEHACLEWTPGGWTLRDLGSTNGTRLGRRELAPDTREVLGNDAEIGIGPLILRLHAENTSAPPLPIDPHATLRLGASEGLSELERLARLLDLRIHHEAEWSLEATLQKILDQALELSGAERACILLAGGDGSGYTAGRDAGGNLLAEDAMSPSRSVLRQARREGRAVFMTEGLDASLAAQASIVAMDLRAVACLPLPGEDGIRGWLYLDSRKAMHTLSGLDEKILTALAGEAARVIERVQWLQERQERERLQRELDFARRTQEALLPKTCPDVPGWTWIAHCEPARHVGGDFYDFVALADGSTYLLLADVSGKGPAAALLAASVQSALRLLLREGVEATHAFTRLNDHLCERSEEGQFVSVFCARLGADGRGEWISAGHPPAFLWRAADGSIELLGRTGVLLGALETDRFGIEFRAEPVNLQPGDLLLVYSDGLTEAESACGELFGEDRARELLSARAPEGAAALGAAVLQAVAAFVEGAEVHDDITLVGVRREP